MYICIVSKSNVYLNTSHYKQKILLNFEFSLDMQPLYSIIYNRYIIILNTKSEINNMLRVLFHWQDGIATDGKK